MKQLKDGVEAIHDSDHFRLFLTTMGKFHDYSIGNLILIALQKKDATKVAGFNTWKDLGRYVKAGERGIAILAPVMPRRQAVAYQSQPEPVHRWELPKLNQGTAGTPADNFPYYDKDSEDREDDDGEGGSEENEDEDIS